MFSSFDKYLQKVLDYGKGIRLMKDLNTDYRILEAVLTQNTSVKMIKIMQRNLFVNFWQRVKINGENIYTFPTASKIAALEEG